MRKIDFLNPAKLSGSGRIFAGAGFGKSARFRPEPKSGTDLIQICINTHRAYSLFYYDFLLALIMMRKLKAQA